MQLGLNKALKENIFDMINKKCKERQLNDYEIFEMYKL